VPPLHVEEHPGRAFATVWLHHGVGSTRAWDAFLHVRGDAVTVATLRRMGPPTEWPAPMQRSLRRAHGPDWAEVAGRWYALWTAPSWGDWTAERIDG
jgi:hypothetical protein